MYRWSVALLAGVCISVLVTLFGIAPLNNGSGLSPLHSYIALGVGSFATLFTLHSLRPFPRDTPPRSGIDWLLIGLFTLFAARSFLWLIFQKGDHIAFLNGNNRGDLALHITYIQSFARHFTFWPDNPIFSGSPLRYPFGIDLFNTLLLQAGLPLFRGLVWVGLCGACLTGVALWRWGKAFALAGFLCNGGIAAWQFFQTGIIDDYQAAVAWKSIPLALFVTQRSLLYALPVGLTLLWSWKRRLLSRTSSPLPLWLELLFYCTLPLFHLHTFLFLSLMLGAWVILGLLVATWGRPRVWGRRLALGSLQLIALAFIPATLLVTLVAGLGSAGSSIHWLSGWMQKQSGHGPLYFWWLNFGFWPLAALLLLGWLWWQWRSHPSKAATWQHLLLSLPSLGIFILACFVMFAVWEWDNTKLFLWSYLILLVPLRAMLSRTPVAVQASAWALLFGSGFISLLGGLGLTDTQENGYNLIRRSELSTIETSLRRLLLPHDARIAFMPTYDHPLLLLGYPGVVGYEGHLYSHGLDYRSTFAATHQLLKGEPGWEEAAHALQVSYLFWGDKEEAAFGRSPQGWRAQAAPVASSSHGTLYYLKRVPISSIPTPLKIKEAPFFWKKSVELLPSASPM